MQLYSCRIQALKKCSNLAIDMGKPCQHRSGRPGENIVTAVEEPTMEVSNYIFKHKDIDMLCATGGPGVVTAVSFLRKESDGRQAPAILRFW